MIIVPFVERVKALVPFSAAKYQNIRPIKGKNVTHRWGCETKHKLESGTNIVDKYRETVDKVYKLGRNLKKYRIPSFWIPPYMGLIPARAGYIRGTFFL
jgi:hypothetical protein